MRRNALAMLKRAPAAVKRNLVTQWMIGMHTSHVAR
jgi:hypothetical protein